MTDDTILSPCPRALDPRDAEALAKPTQHGGPVFSLRTMGMAMAEIRRLRARITELEAAAAVTRGTLAAPAPDDDQPATYTHDVPPNAPR